MIALRKCRLCKAEPTRVDDYADSDDKQSPAQGHYEIGCPDACGVYVWAPTLEEAEARWNALMGAPSPRPVGDALRSYECSGCHNLSRPTTGVLVINLGADGYLCHDCARLVVEIVQEHDEQWVSERQPAAEVSR